MGPGAAGVLVGFGGGAAHTTRNVFGIQVPMATAVADVAGARRDYMDESGGRYVHVIADGGVGWSGDLPKAIACGADAVMMGSPLARATDAPGRGRHWGMEAVHEDVPRGKLVDLGSVGTTEEADSASVVPGGLQQHGGVRGELAASARAASPRAVRSSVRSGPRGDGGADHGGTYRAARRRRWWAGTPPRASGAPRRR
ncbi:GuaB3 family IMP dehydrogenase-related protein OS=Streptomyces alboniger OX=132473 GN=CP975_21305 PE=3 SV=1 [Streptomyces alboniger]